MEAREERRERVLDLGFWKRKMRKLRVLGKVADRRKAAEKKRAPPRV